ncbi:hypothetical protein Slin14017_G017180 [Septoria linicola]|nr:hypothetical protein Slin14017_G017180 [Septoria linicola]
MLLSKLFATSVLAATALAACPDQQRIAAIKYIVDAFNEVDFPKSAELIAGMPLAPQCQAFLFINGLPGVSPAFDATTVKAFSQTVRQVFGHVEPKPLAPCTLFPLPIDTRIVVPAIFDEETCLITELPTYITIPTSLAGNPISPPTVPKIPGLERLPGFSADFEGVASGDWKLV